MNRQDVANLALRITGLFAITCTLGMLGVVLSAIASLVQYAGSGVGPAGESWFMVGAAGVSCLTLLSFGLVLLLAAPAFARRIFPTTEHTGDPVRFLGLHAFAYSIVGLLVAVRGLAGLTGCVALFDREYQMQSWPLIVRTFAPSGVELILGLALFFGSHGLVRIWTRLRYAGLRRQMSLCVHCGYDLTGNTSGVCPECGTAISQPPALPIGPGQRA